MNEESIIQMIEEAEGFPELSDVTTDIARMTSDLSAPISKIAEKIESDPALLVRMLKVINTDFYGLTGNVTKIADAVHLIGYKKVCNLAVSISILDMFPNKPEGGFDYTQFWQHSIYSGVSAGEISARVPGDQPADVFSAGLIQNVGTLFLVRHRPLEFGTALGYSKSQGVSLAVAERETWGGDHALVGAMVCQRWQLPQLMVEVMRHHHFAEFGEAAPEGTRGIIQVMNLASLFADLFQYPEDKEIRETLDKRGNEFFSFGPKTIDQLLERITSEVQEMGLTFSVEMEAGAEVSPNKAVQANFLTTCPECGTEDQTGKFCMECGGGLEQKEQKTERSTRKVLIAEDSIASRRALSFVIKKLGYIPVESTNGYEAIELAKKDPPGMIMLDVVMPRMNGLEALKRIREDEQIKDIPVVMLTSLTDSETVVEAVQAGANDYVVKPYTADIIWDRVKKYMPEDKKRR